jgi:hypothetical protein
MSADLQAEVEQYADTAGRLLQAMFEDAPTPLAEWRYSRYVIELEPVPLKVQGESLAELRVIEHFCLDSAGEHLAVQKSTFSFAAVVHYKVPIIRWEFERDAHTKPHAHVHVHAERGALSHLLSRTDRAAPHSLESLHIPVGGTRFRPCLEDVVQFLIVECGFDAKTGWPEAVERQREEWRRVQLRAAVRDAPGEAAAELQRLGYSITAPRDGTPMDRFDRLRAW